MAFTILNDPTSGDDGTTADPKIVVPSLSGGPNRIFPSLIVPILIVHGLQARDQTIVLDYGCDVAFLNYES